MLKKLLTLVLTVVLAVSLTTTAHAVRMPSDVSGHWIEGTIRDLLANPLAQFMLGGGQYDYLLERFHPDRAVTRVEFCGVMNAINRFNQEADITFTDANTPEVARILRIAAQAGYFQGVGGGRANPHGQLTRAEAATMIQRIYNHPAAPGESRRFTDRGDIPSWAADAVDALVKAGVFRGDDQNRFNPNAVLTRAEILALVNNLVFN